MSDDILRRHAQSWADNAERWIDALARDAIRSRAAVTNGAILAAIAERPPARLLDLGCGEGWILRAAAAAGAEAVGVDACAALTDAARAGGASVFTADYDMLARDNAVAPGPFDVIVVNFALLDDRPQTALAAARRRLAPGGRILVQTLHPISQADAYVDGWREERFDAFDETADGSGASWAPMPWRHNTLAAWSAAFDAAELRIAKIDEPRESPEAAPASILFHLEPQERGAADLARVAALAVTWREGRVLLARRLKPPQRLHWGFPGGGLRPRETLFACAERELFEETGVRAEATALRPPVEVDEPGAPHYVLAPVLLAYRSGAPVAADDVDAADWFAPDALPEPLCDGVAELVRETREAAPTGGSAQG